MSFVLVGMAQALYGPALPEFQQRLGAGVADAGLIVSAHFAGVVLGMSVWLLVPRSRLWLAYCVALGIGCLGLAVGSSVTSLVAFALLTGSGCGGLIVALNTAVAALPDLPTRWLNALNAAYGFGAAAALGLSIALPSASSLYYLIAVGGLLAGACLLVPKWALSIHGRRQGAAGARPRSDDKRRRLVEDQAVRWISLGLALLLVLYDVLEASIAAWAVTWLNGPGVSALVGSLWMFVFWTLYGCGRLSAAVLAGRMRPSTLAAVTLGGAALTLPLLWTSRAGLWLLLVGLLLGPVYPAVLGWLVDLAHPSDRKLGLAVLIAMCGPVPALAGIGLMVSVVGPSATRLSWTSLLVGAACLAYVLASATSHHTPRAPSATASTTGRKRRRHQGKARRHTLVMDSRRHPSR